MEAAVFPGGAVSAGSRRKARPGIAALIWSKGSPIAAPAIRRATPSGAERKDRFAGGRGRRLDRLCARSIVPRPGAVGCAGAAFYLRNGWHDLHGIARGPMAPVIDNVAALPDTDRQAMASYIAGHCGRAERGTTAGRAGADRTRPRAAPGKQTGGGGKPDNRAGRRFRRYGRAHLSGGLRGLSRKRPPASLRRHRSCVQHRPERPRCAQRDQCGAVWPAAGGGWHAQPDHAGLRQRPDGSAARRFAGTICAPDSATGRHGRDIARADRRCQRRRGPALPIRATVPIRRAPSSARARRHDEAHRQWPHARHRRRSGHAAALRVAGRACAQRREVRLRSRPMRGLHGAGGRRSRVLLPRPPCCCWKAGRITTIEGLGTIDNPGRCSAPSWTSRRRNAATASPA